MTNIRMSDMDAMTCTDLAMSDCTEQLLHSLSVNGPRGMSDCSPQNKRRDNPFEDYVNLADLITVNVGGARFVTSRHTLDRIPNTRLSNLCKSDKNFNPVTQEWFFDRNPVLFNYILDYYRSDELHFPHNYCGPSIKKELIYWGVDDGDINPCCWNRYREFEQEKKIFEQLDQAFESHTSTQWASDDQVNPSQWLLWRKRIFLLLEEPMSSRMAQIWTIAFLAVVLSSIGVLCIETHKWLRVPMEDAGSTTTMTPILNQSLMSSAHGDDVTYRLIQSQRGFLNSTASTVPPLETTTSEYDGWHARAMENPKIYQLFNTQPHPALEHIDTFCTCFFTVEFLVRFFVAPNRIQFLRNVMNIIDILCVLPMWIKYIMIVYDIKMNLRLMPVFFIIMMLRVLRICRVLRLARHYTGVKILLLALKASFRELAMLVIFVFIVVLIFAVVIYYAEFFTEDTFLSIPEGYWWAIITLTTVGYGDMYPKSAIGYVVGALCALTGILATGLPVPIIANNFNLYYTHAQLKDALKNRKGHEAHPSDGSRRASDQSNLSSIKGVDSKPEPLIVKEATV